VDFSALPKKTEEGLQATRRAASLVQREVSAKLTEGCQSHPVKKQPEIAGRQMQNENRRRPERWRSGIGTAVLPVERFSPLMKGKYGVPEKSKRFFGEEERQANG